MHKNLHMPPSLPRARPLSMGPRFFALAALVAACCVPLQVCCREPNAEKCPRRQALPPCERSCCDPAFAGHGDHRARRPARLRSPNYQIVRGRHLTPAVPFRYAFLPAGADFVERIFDDGTSVANARKAVAIVSKKSMIVRPRKHRLATSYADAGCALAPPALRASPVSPCTPHGKCLARRQGRKPEARLLREVLGSPRGAALSRLSGTRRRRSSRSRTAQPQPLSCQLQRGVAMLKL